MDSTERIIARYQRHEENLIQILQDIQAEHNYLPESVVKYVAQRLHVPLSRIYSVATFYNAFTLKPRGRHCITVCTGTACHVRGAPALLAEFERRLDIKAGENTRDMEYTLNTVNCLGCCAIGPIVVNDGTYHGHFGFDDIKRILKEHR